METACKVQVLEGRSDGSAENAEGSVAACFALGIPSDGIIDFLTMDGDVPGGIDANPHFVTSNFHDGDSDIIADDDRFVALAGQHKHDCSPSGERIDLGRMAVQEFCQRWNSSILRRGVLHCASGCSPYKRSVVGCSGGLSGTLRESLDGPIDMHSRGFAIVSVAFEGRCVMFANRIEAGQRLAERIRALGVNGFTTVLGLPRGGVPVAAEVARLLDVPFDVLVVRKLGHPANPELAMGAVAEDGVRVINQDLAGDSEKLQASVHAASLEVRRRVRRFRGGRALPPLNGRTVILVDDELATGASMQAAVSAVRQKHPARIVVAIPVGPPEVLRSIAAVADEVICLQSPEIFSAVGEFYEDFGEVTDEDAEQLLKQHARGVPSAVGKSVVRSAD